MQSVERLLASVEEHDGITDFANFDRARFTLGLKSSAGDPRAREKEMSLEEALKEFGKYVENGRDERVKSKGGGGGTGG